MLKRQLVIYTDGGSRGNPGIAGGGVVVMDQTKEIIFEGSFAFGIRTNNEAEYLSFLQSLYWIREYAKRAEIISIEWFLDSKLVVEQINKRWKIKKTHLLELANQCWASLAELDSNFTVRHVKRDLNKKADQLANLAMDAYKN